MLRTPLAVGLAATLLLAGCGGGDDSPSSASPTPSATAKPLTEAQLKAALITKADLPAAYVVDASADEDDDITLQAATPACQEKYDVLEAAQDNEGVSAEVSFEQADKGILLNQSWEASEDSIATITTQLATFRSLVGDCPKVTFVSDDGTPPIPITFSSVTFPKLGDDSLALKGSGTVAGFPFSIAFAFVRVGTNKQTVLQGGLGEADLALLQKVARLGVERLPR